MIFTSPITSDVIESSKEMSSWVDKLEEKLSEKHSGVSTNYTFKTQPDPERNIFLPEATLNLHGLERKYLFSADFFNSGEYKALADLGKTLDGLIEE